MTTSRWKSAWLAVGRLLMVGLVVLAVLLLGVIEMVCLLFAPVSQELVERIIAWYSRWLVRLLLATVTLGRPETIKFYNCGGAEITNFDALRSRGQSYLILSNHISALDTVLTGAVGQDILQLRLKYITKDSLKWIPLIGWAMRFAGYLFVKRSKIADKDNIKKWCGQLKHRHREGLVIYPEGTRITEKKHQLSTAYAIKTNRPVLKHLLFPRVHGFQVCADALRHGTFTSAMHVAIVYTENGQRAEPPGFFFSLFNPLPGRFAVILDPEHHLEIDSPEEYLIKKFVEKDQLIDRFISSHSSQADRHLHAASGSSAL